LILATDYKMRESFKKVFGEFRKEEKGFTFLEIIITLFVFVIGVLAVYLVAQQPIIYASRYSNQLVASYLAQEGVEIVRNIRDTSWIDSPTDWIAGLAEGETKDFEADYAATAAAGFNIAACSPSCNYEGLRLLQLNPGGFYNYGSGPNTKFKRRIRITKDVDDTTPGVIVDILNISVTVFWSERGKTYEVTAAENIYYWFR